MPPFDRAHTCSYSALIETVSILYRFRDIAGYLSKVVDFDPPYTCIRRPVEFVEIFGVRQLESLGYRVVLFV